VWQAEEKLGGIIGGGGENRWFSQRKRRRSGGGSEISAAAWRKLGGIRKTWRRHAGGIGRQRHQLLISGVNGCNGGGGAASSQQRGAGRRVSNRGVAAASCRKISGRQSKTHRKCLFGISSVNGGEEWRKPAKRRGAEEKSRRGSHQHQAAFSISSISRKNTEEI
jgi:hypothetical protein